TGRLAASQPAGNHMTGRSWSVRISRMFFCAPGASEARAVEESNPRNCDPKAAPAAASEERFKNSRRETAAAGEGLADTGEDDAGETGRGEGLGVMATGGDGASAVR